MFYTISLMFNGYQIEMYFINVCNSSNSTIFDGLSNINEIIKKLTDYQSINIIA
jgi:hypothetical protein